VSGTAEGTPLLCVFFCTHFSRPLFATLLPAPQRWASVYAWQHVYLPLLYGFLAIKVRIEDVLSLWVQ
jgi:hypothetical protein